jgi:hypothetical protein
MFHSAKVTEKKKGVMDSHEFNSENTKPRITGQRFQSFFSVPLR